MVLLLCGLTVGSLLVLVGSCFGQLPGLPCGNAAGCCSLGASSDSCLARTILQDPRASAGFLVGGLGSQRPQSCCPPTGRRRTDPGVIAKLLAGTAVFCYSGCKGSPGDPELVSRYFGGGGVVSDAFGYGIHAVLKHVHLLLGRTRALLVSRVESDSVRAG